MTELDPPRIDDTPGMPVELLDALHAARGFAPSADRESALVRGVLAGLGLGPGPSGSEGGSDGGPPDAGPTPQTGGGPTTAPPPVGPIPGLGTAGGLGGADFP